MRKGFLLSPSPRKEEKREDKEEQQAHSQVNLKLTITGIFTLFIYISRRLMSWTTITYEKDLNFKFYCLLR